MDNNTISKEQQLYLDTSFKEEYEEYLMSVLGVTTQVWVYGNKTTKDRPFCVLMERDKSIEIKIDLITLNVLKISIKDGVICEWEKILGFKRDFDKWLENKWYYLYRVWDGCNENNMIEDYIASNNITNINPMLKKYCED